MFLVRTVHTNKQGESYSNKCTLKKIKILHLYNQIMWFSKTKKIINNSNPNLGEENREQWIDKKQKKYRLKQQKRRGKCRIGF